MKNYAAFLRANTTRNETTGCLEWNRYRLPAGYGRTRYLGRNILTHRLAWLLAHSDPGAQLVCHRCDNPPCCNPEHLFLSDHKGNTADALAKGRLNVPRPNQTQRVRRLSHEQIDAIRAEQGTLAAVAAKYGISAPYVSMLRRGLRKTAPRRQNPQP